MKKIYVPFLAIMLCFALCACSSLPFAGSSKVEGKGFDSPEEAILAYAKALNEADISAILSTFAVETYVENYDLEEYVDWTHTYIVANAMLPNSDDYTTEINIRMRESQILRQLSNIYTIYSLGEESFSTAISIPNDQFDDADDLVDNLTVDNWIEILSELEYDTEVLYAEDVVNESAIDGMEKNLDKQCDYYGAKEIVSLALEVELDGEDYYLCMDVARYDDKWYNLNQVGMIALLLGAPSYCGGLVPRE